MKRSVAALIMGLTASAFLPAVPIKPPPTKDDTVSCKIAAPATCELSKAPRVTVELTNNTKEEILLVGSLDGSSVQRRYPHAYFEVVGPDGESAVNPVEGCGYINQLKKEDFIKLAPGKSFNPYEKDKFFGSVQLLDQNFDKPGKYRIRFVYSSEEIDVNRWRGDDSLEPMLKLVPKVTVMSKEIVVEVK